MFEEKKTKTTEEYIASLVMILIGIVMVSVTKDIDGLAGLLTILGIGLVFVGVLMLFIKT